MSPRNSLGHISSHQAHHRLTGTVFGDVLCVTLLYMSAISRILWPMPQSLTVECSVPSRISMLCQQATRGDGYIRCEIFFLCHVAPCARHRPQRVADATICSRAYIVSFRLYTITESVLISPCSHVPAIGRDLWPRLPSASVIVSFLFAFVLYNQVRFFSPCSMCPPSAAACCSACRTEALVPPLSNPPPLLIGPPAPLRPP